MKTPTIVSVHEWTRNGDHPKDNVHPSDVNRKEGEVVRYFRHPQVDGSELCQECGHIYHDHGFLDTSHGGETVHPGDLILENSNGKYRRIDIDTYRKLYYDTSIEANVAQ